MIVLVGKRQNAGDRRFGLLQRIGAVARLAFVVDAKHQLDGLLIIEANEALQHLHDELHRRDVVVVQHHVVKRFVRHRATLRWLIDYHSSMNGYSSMIATARVQPAEARSIFTGKQETMKPVEGSCSRLCSFSIWQ